MTIFNLLKYSPEEYERILFETWLCYADLIAVNDCDLQKILANNAYFNWFKQEYAKLEQDFAKEVKPYLGKLDTTAIRDFYDEKTSVIAENYSKYLLRQARKTNIINHPQLN